MNQLENSAFLADRLMTGPNGTIYVLQSGSSEVLPSSHDLNGPSAAPTTVPLSLPADDGGLGGGCFSYSAAALRMDTGQGTGCFRFSAAAPGDGGMGTGCFRYSADMPGDGGVAGGCFAYSADTSHRDGGEGGGCFKYLAAVPRRDTGDATICFAY
jgi:hypothetical protein